VKLGRLRASFLSLVETEAAAEAARRDEERAERLAAIRTEGERLVAEAAAKGEQEGSEVATRMIAVARRQARAEVLTAQRDVYEQLRAVIVAEAVALRGAPSYPGLVERIAADLRAELGASATLEVDPDPVGGVIARRGSRIIDCSLPALARRCLDSLGSEVESLWA